MQTISLHKLFEDNKEKLVLDWINISKFADGERNIEIKFNERNQINCQTRL